MIPALIGSLLPKLNGATVPNFSSRYQMQFPTILPLTLCAEGRFEFLMKKRINVVVILFINIDNMSLFMGNFSNFQPIGVILMAIHTGQVRRYLTVFLMLAILISFSALFQVHGQSSKRKTGLEERKIGLIDSLPSSSKRYALIIGVNQYEDPKIAPLKGATNDAQTLADTLKQYAGFPSDQVMLLTTDQQPERLPKRNTILEALSNLASAARRDGGMLLVSFAGHGIERGKKPFLLSSDARLGNDNDVELLEETAVSVTSIKNKLRGLDQVLLI